MTDILGKMQRYIQNTKGSDIPERFQLRTSEVIAIMDIARSGDAERLLDAVLTVYSYGFSKRARIACAENKKRCLT